MSVIDRKRAPVPQKEAQAQLPARTERESILARARALVANKSTAQTPTLPVARKQTAPERQSARANLPVAASRTVTARARPNVPAARPSGQREAPPAAENQVVEVPAQNGGGSTQTIIVQVAAPQPVYPWWYGYGPYWWGYHPAPCSSRKCPRRSGLPCTSWLCN
jgi:hypothetical protein